MLKYYKEEYENITRYIVNNKEFLDTKNKRHHGITRYEHLLRVSYYSYIITKMLRLNYVEAARGALLHDFFIDETKDDHAIKALRNHPTYALENAKKHFVLTEREEDIIKTHMFPVTFTPPKYLESWIVDMVDDVSGVYERYKSSRNEFQTAIVFLVVILANIINR